MRAWIKSTGSRFLICTPILCKKVLEYIGVHVNAAIHCLFFLIEEMITGYCAIRPFSMMTENKQTIKGTASLGSIHHLQMSLFKG